jgi:hypothetical protein
MDSIGARAEVNDHPFAMSHCVKWDEIVKLLIEPKDPTATVPVDLEAAAKGQIESAILLWFLEADIASIHSLAAAAWEIIHNTGKRIGKPSRNRKEIENWPLAKQEHLKIPWNFAKHGTDRKFKAVSVNYKPKQTNAILLDAVNDFISLYDRATPLMRIFGARITLEYPNFLKPGHTPGLFLDHIAVDGIANLCRSEFLLEALVLHGRSQAAKSAQNKRLTTG